MKNPLYKKHFLKLFDFSREELDLLLALSARLKAEKREGIAHKVLTGKNVALIFEKSSTRTRCAFEVAASDLGMQSTYLDGKGSQIGVKESIADTARVLARMFDGIEYRGYGQKRVEELAHYAGIPVWNGLTDEFHPTQMLAAALTLREEFGELKNLKLVFMGDAHNNVANSLMVLSAIYGMHYVACAPMSYFPEQNLIKGAQQLAEHSGATFEFISDPKQAVMSADAVYTDVWVSMGEPFERWAERIELMKPYQVTSELMQLAKPASIFMHCLPSFHDTNTQVGKEIFERFGLSELEVTNEVFESAQSRVFDEAENRLHTIKAVMYASLSETLPELKV